MLGVQVGQIKSHTQCLPKDPIRQVLTHTVSGHELYTGRLRSISNTGPSISSRTKAVEVLSNH